MCYLKNNHFALENGHEVARFFSHADSHLNRLSTVLLVQSDRLICTSCNFILRSMTSLWDVFKNFASLLDIVFCCNFIISTTTWVLLYFSILLLIPCQSNQLKDGPYCVLPDEVPPWAQDSTPYNHTSWLWNLTKFKASSIYRQF